MGTGTAPAAGGARGAGRKRRAGLRAKVKGRPEVTDPRLIHPAGRGRGWAALREPQPIGAAGDARGARGRHLVGGQRRRAERGGDGGGRGTAGRPGRGRVPGRSRVLFLPGGRTSAAVSLPPSPGCCRVPFPARRERAVAGVAGQGHRAPPENRIRVGTGPFPSSEGRLGSSPSLCISQARDNMILSSQVFANSVWQTFRGAVSLSFLTVAQSAELTLTW